LDRDASVPILCIIPWQAFIYLARTDASTVSVKASVTAFTNHTILEQPKISFTLFCKIARYHYKVSTLWLELSIL